MRNTLFTILVGCLIVSVGCSHSDDELGFSGHSLERAFQGFTGHFSQTEYTGNVHVLKAVMDGEYGYVTDIHHVAHSVSADRWDDTLSVYLTVDTDEGAAMAIINVSDAFSDDPAYGITVVDHSDDSAVTGCSGPEIGYWTADDQAPEPEVEIHYDPKYPDVMAVHFTAAIPDYGYGSSVMPVSMPCYDDEMGEYGGEDCYYDDDDYWEEPEWESTPGGTLSGAILIQLN